MTDTELTPYKPKGWPVVIIDGSGMSLECDAAQLEFKTWSDFTSWVEGFDLQDISRILIIDPRRKDYANKATVRDETADVAVQWMGGLDALDWDERHGKPECMTDGEWDEALREAAGERADYYAQMRDPMGYHFGRNWHGVKTGSF